MDTHSVVREWVSWISWISQHQTRATVEIYFTRLRLVKNISTVALVWYCEIHSHDSCVYTKTPPSNDILLKGGVSIR